MEFKDVFREMYRNTLHAARANDVDNTIEGLKEIYTLFSEQFAKNNGDPIVIKAKLSYWRDAFGTYIDIINQYGIKDARIQKLFGLSTDEKLPSLSDILKGDAKIDNIAKNDDSSIDISGVIASDENEDNNSNTDNLNINEQSEVNDTNISEDVTLSGDNGLENNETQVTDLTPSFEPQSLKDFIGQRHIVKALLKEIAIAKNEGRKHLDNILLLGNPGLGKTTLMNLIAKELGVNYELLDCSQFRNSQQSLAALQAFFMKIAKENKPVVIALDEIHALNETLQSSLLTLLNNRVYVSPLDKLGNCVRIPIEEFTFIAATTDDDKVLETIKNRCLRLKFQMVDYTEDELRQIYKNKIASKGLTVTEEAIDLCIPRSRGAIRYVNAIVDGLNSALYNDEGRRISTNITLDVTEQYFKDAHIKKLGLSDKDIEILNAIRDNSLEAIGVDVLAAKVGLDPKKYQSEYERYLIKIGFIAISGRGRILTEKAIRYLENIENNE
ncbi:MAG: AAA family ATPase [Clostridia bacterium]|nr:AAA family ATPase [Clostridia bacterium]